MRSRLHDNPTPGVGVAELVVREVKLREKYDIPVPAGLKATYDHIRRTCEEAEDGE